MHARAAALVATLLMSAALCACNGNPERGPVDSPVATTLVGRVLLPAGTGSRGVEVRVLGSETEGTVAWPALDEQGRFTQALREAPSGVGVTAGPEVHRIEAGALPAADANGRVDVGVIDLRDELTEHRLVVRAADRAAPGVVRASVWFGPPPVGPQGEPVSLGSSQFPEIALGTEVAWLFPHDAHSLHFLVERPSGPGRGREWRSGPQQLFGPFPSAELPAELVLD